MKDDIAVVKKGLQKFFKKRFENTPLGYYNKENEIPPKGIVGG